MPSGTVQNEGILWQGTNDYMTSAQSLQNTSNESK